jgi:hypothetical protein
MALLVKRIRVQSFLDLFESVSKSWLRKENIRSCGRHFLHLAYYQVTGRNDGRVRGQKQNDSALHQNELGVFQGTSSIIEQIAY